MSSPLSALRSPLSALRSPLSALLISVSLISPVFGILDQDGDGMSDLWESQYGFSPSSNTIPSQLPAADPDGDGVTNLRESVAGTDPLSTVPPLGTHQLTFQVNAANPMSYDLRWQQFIGKQYQVLTSDSLVAGTWLPLASPFIATIANLATITTPPRTAGFPKNFYRISVADVDPDSDDLTSWEESILGTNPLVADTDGDGKSDKAEIIQGSSPDDPSDNGLAPAQPELLPMKLKIFTYASLATDYVNGGIDGLLTPYRIKIYQQNLLTGVETLVHTTPDYGGSAFSLTNSVELPNISNDPTRRYTAQIDLPSISTDTFSQPYRRWSFFLSITANVGGAPFIGVNGLEPITQTFGTAGHILRALNVYNPGFSNYRAAIEPIDLTWKSMIGFDNVGAHVDPWNLPISGSRIFPDFKNPLDTVLRHKLELIVKTSAALAGKAIFVKAFDVDDSTSEAFDAADGAAPSVDTNGKSGNDNLPDYLGTAPNGQFWTGAAWGGDTAQGIVDTNGEAKFIFRVGMQPGNNYRVIASLLDPSMITGIQVTTSTAPKYLGPAFAQNAGAHASPLLTVWRRLWIENDSMAAIPVDPFGYKRNDLGADLDPPVIRNVSFAAATGNTTFGIDEITDQSSFLNLQNGRMIFQGVTHPVVSTGSYAVTVAGDHSDVPVNSGFRLYDDDEFGLDAPALPRLNLVNNDFKAVYKPAFIEVIDANTAGYNLSKILDFYRNYPVAIGPQSLFSGIWENTKDLTDSNALWVGNLFAAYQGDSYADGDPNSEGSVEGITRPNCRYSIVYVEVVRDTVDLSLRPPSLGIPEQKILVERNKSLTAAHEIGHMPGGGSEQMDHDEGKLMSEDGYDGGLTFSSRSIRRFRISRTWQQSKN